MSIAPKCQCGHSKSRHATDSTKHCLAWYVKGQGGACFCVGYQPRRLTRVRAPLPRKSAAPKRTKCPRKQRKTGRAALGRLADKLCGQIVRSRGRCETYECRSGDATLQWAHGFSRRYRATRWLPINGFALCRSHHFYYTLRPLEWDQWLRYQWGEPAYTELRYLALSSQAVDLEATIAKLREEADKLGLR